MLLRFSVSNHRSIASRISLDLIAAPRLRLHSEHILPTADGQPPALPIAVIWGANASGKTNIVDAIHFAKSFIVNAPELDIPIPVNPFRLDRQSMSEPSEFEWVMQIEGSVWRYFFSVNSQQVLHEALYRERATKSDAIYVRDNQEVRFGEALKFENDFGKFVARGLLGNELFLAAAARKNMSPMQGIFRWIKRISVITPDSIPTRLPEMLDKNESLRGFAETFLSTSGTGIESVAINKVPLREGEDEFAYFNSNSKQSGIKRSQAPYVFENSNGTTSHLNVQFKHEGAPDVPFELKDESRGTQRLFHLTPALYDSQQTPKLVVIDELDSSLHPTLVKHFVECFLNDRIAGAQLILTTHDATLLDLDLLRRDEIWFTDKDKLGATHLTSLHEYINRSDVDLDKHYLAGRFGGVPKIRSSRKLRAANRERSDGEAQA